VFPKRK